MKKKIMILGASVLQQPAIKQAKEMGLEVVVVDINPNATGFDEKGIIKEVIDTTDIPNVLLAAKKHKIDGIMTLASDLPTRTVAAVAKELTLPGIDEYTAIKATDKFEMRKALKKAAVPIPIFYKASSLVEFEECIKHFDGKFITKPADNSGSRGIFLVDDISKAREAFEYSKMNSRNGDVMVEEFMEGPEVSVETMTIDGVCHVIQITDKLTTGAPHFVEMGHSQPSLLSLDLQKKISKIAIDANRAVGINFGPSHTEIIVTNEGPKVVELGARLGGDCITSSLVPLSTGINMVEKCIRIALGENVSVLQTIKKGSAIRYFHHTDGIVEEICGLENAMKLQGVVEIKCFVKKGDYVQSITNSGTRIGYVIAQDNSPELAISDCNKAINAITINTRR